MSIELKQAAQQAVEAYDEFDECGDYASLLDLEVKMGKLRTAIQQIESEPVLTVEKEPDYWSGGHFYEGCRSHIDPTKVWNLPIGTKLYTHPAPDVPDGYVLVRYPITEGMHAAACKVLIRSHGLSGVPQRMLTAMLAASQAQKGAADATN